MKKRPEAPPEWAAENVDSLMAALQARRLARGISQAEMGRLVRVASGGTVANWEAGRWQPQASRLALWAGVLGLRLELREMTEEELGATHEG